MDDLVAFLGACLDEDERVARAAIGGEWIVPAAEPNRVRTHDGGDVASTGAGFAAPVGAGTAAHVARWDPARVLAEVAAKREILRLHERDDDYGDGTDAVCHRCNAGGYDMAGDLRPEKYPCRTIFALAASYRSAPGWHPEWATEVET